MQLRAFCQEAVAQEEFGVVSQERVVFIALETLLGGVSNVDIDGNNAFQIKAIGVVIPTFETLPHTPNPPAVSAQGRLHFLNA